MSSGNEDTVYNTNSFNIKSGATIKSVKLQTTGGTASDLDYYETGVVSIPLSGSITGNATIRYVRLGALVTLQFATTTGTPTLGATLNSAAALPVNLRPLNPVRAPISVVDNNANATTYGCIDIQTNGNFTVFRGPAGVGAIFTAGATI